MNAYLLAVFFSLLLGAIIGAFLVCWGIKSPRRTEAEE